MHYIQWENIQGICLISDPYKHVFCMVWHLSRLNMYHICHVSWDRRQSSFTVYRHSVWPNPKRGNAKSVNPSSKIAQMSQTFNDHSDMQNNILRILEYYQLTHRQKLWCSYNDYRTISTFSFLQMTNRSIGWQRYFLLGSEVRNAGNTASLPPWQISRKHTMPPEETGMPIARSWELEVFGSVCEHKNT